MGGITQIYHGLSTCMGDNPLAKASGLSPHTGGQTIPWFVRLCGRYPLAKASGLSPHTGGQTCVGDNPLAKASGLSPHTGGQTMV